jgi:hypothetical protein
VTSGCACARLSCCVWGAETCVPRPDPSPHKVRRGPDEVQRAGGWLKRECGTVWPSVRQRRRQEACGAPCGGAVELWSGLRVTSAMETACGAAVTGRWEALRVGVTVPRAGCGCGTSAASKSRAGAGAARGGRLRGVAASTATLDTTRRLPARGRRQQTVRSPCNALSHAGLAGMA